MDGTVSMEMQVNVPPSKAWELYGTLQLSQLMGKSLPGLDKADVQGDGGVGTILHAVFLPGSGFPSFKEKFVTVDDKKRVKVTEMIEGGYLDLGFSLYRLRFEVCEKCEDWCITRITAEYEVKGTDVDLVAANNASSTKLLVSILEAAKNYLTTTTNMNGN